MMTTILLGGILIGASAGGLFLLEGRIAGVSGMAAGVFDPARRDRLLRFAFVAGLIAGGVVVEAVRPGSLPTGYDGSPSWILAAGLFVGVGSRLANGCTSGHGVCGVARGSGRSLTAVATFVAVGALTSLIVRSFPWR